MGVACLKIEGRMKRPEYVAGVTGIYRRLLDEKRRPTAAESAALEQAFSRSGFTDGYWLGAHRHTEVHRDLSVLFSVFVYRPGLGKQLLRLRGVLRPRAEHRLAKTGGTVFAADQIEIDLDQGLMVSASAVNGLRRELLDAGADIRFGASDCRCSIRTPTAKGFCSMCSPARYSISKVSRALCPSASTTCRAGRS